MKRVFTLLYDRYRKYRIFLIHVSFWNVATLILIFYIFVNEEDTFLSISLFSMNNHHHFSTLAKSRSIFSLTSLKHAPLDPNVITVLTSTWMAADLLLHIWKTFINFNTRATWKFTLTLIVCAMRIPDAAIKTATKQLTWLERLWQ